MNPISKGEMHLTGSNIAKTIKDIILMTDVNKVTAVVAANTSNIRAAWDILEANYLHIFCNGCVAYVINLLIIDKSQTLGYGSL